MLGALGAGLLPESVIAYLGLVPLFVGIRAGWLVWLERHKHGDAASNGAPQMMARGTTVVTVAGVTFANGLDNLGVYVPVFSTTDTIGLITYIGVFLAMVALWCTLGRYFATRPLIA